MATDIDLDTLDRGTKVCLMIALGTGCPGWAPSGTTLAACLDEHGRLNDYGRVLAARVTLAEPDCQPTAYARAHEILENARS